MASAASFPAWAVAKDNTELLAFLNEFIAKEKASGRFADEWARIVRTLLAAG